MHATAVGGRRPAQEPNAADAVVPAKSGELSLEQVVTLNPDVILETRAEASAEAMAEVYEAPDKTSLRDIAEATYGPPPPQKETVHGPDNRVRINNTSVYPWRANASLLITAADGSQWIGTGWFIGPHTLMTAGHVVNIPGSGVPGRDGWVRRIQVMPGRNGATLPYGSVTSSSFRSVAGWTNSVVEIMGDYQRVHGLKCIGPHRPLADQVFAGAFFRGATCHGSG